MGMKPAWVASSICSMLFSRYYKSVAFQEHITGDDRRTLGKTSEKRA